jgi:hypothetical protein
MNSTNVSTTVDMSDNAFIIIYATQPVRLFHNLHKMWYDKEFAAFWYEFAMSPVNILMSTCKHVC